MKSGTLGLLKSALRLTPFHARKLWSVVFFVTHRCNMRCPYCNLPSMETPEMTATQILDLAGQFKRISISRVGITGGEPLLREDLKEILSSLDAMGLYINLNTNGWLLPEKLDQVKHANLITTSVDGPKELHDRIHQDGSFDRLTKGLKAVQAKGVKTAAIIVVTSHNLPYLRETLKTLTDLNTRIYLQPVTRCDISTKFDDDLMPPKEQFISEIKWLINNRRRFSLGTSNAFLKHLLKYPDYQTAFPCKAGKSYVHVTPDGKLTACHIHFLPENPSALDLGVEAALMQVKRSSDCQGCAISSYMELNFISNFNIGSLWNALRTAK